MRWVGKAGRAHWAIVLQDTVLNAVNQWFLAGGQGCTEGPQYLAPAERHLEGEGSFPSLRRSKTAPGSKKGGPSRRSGSQ